MTQVTGYIVGVENPNMSGLATVTIATERNARSKLNPRALRTHIDAGFGVRQLVAFFGSWDQMVMQGQETRLNFEIENGLIKSFTSAEEN